MLLTHIPSERSPGGPLPRSVARGHGRAFCPAPTRSIAALRPGPATGTCPTACSSLRCRERPEAPLTRPATPGGSARPHSRLGPGPPPGLQAPPGRAGPPGASPASTAARGAARSYRDGARHQPRSP